VHVLAYQSYVAQRLSIRRTSDITSKLLPLVCHDIASLLSRLRRRPPVSDVACLPRLLSSNTQSLLKIVSRCRRTLRDEFHSAAIAGSV